VKSGWVGEFDYNSVPEDMERDVVELYIDQESQYRKRSSSRRGYEGRYEEIALIIKRYNKRHISNGRKAEMTTQYIAAHGPNPGNNTSLFIIA